MTTADEPSKPPFTKDAVLEELKIMLFCQASQIAVAFNYLAADNFIGISIEDWSSAEWDDYIAHIDLSRFEITRLIEYAYDFAFQVGAYWIYNSDVGYNTTAFGNGTVAASFLGEGSPYHQDGSKVRHVIEMAQAREFLDLTHSDLSVRELCLLSGMSEPSVRNSLSKEGIPTEGKPVRVDNENARKWLMGRRGFVPTRISEISQKSEKRYREFLLTAYPAHECAKRGLADTGMTIEALAQKISADVSKVSAFLEGQPSKDIDLLKSMASALEFDVPDFVVKAIRDYFRDETASK